MVETNQRGLPSMQGGVFADSVVRRRVSHDGIYSI